MIGRMIGTAVTASLLRGVTGRFGGVAGMVAGAPLSLVALTAYDLWKRRHEQRGGLPTPQVGGDGATPAAPVGNPFAKDGPAG